MFAVCCCLKRKLNTNKSLKHISRMHIMQIELVFFFLPFASYIFVCLFVLFYKSNGNGAHSFKWNSTQKQTEHFVQIDTKVYLLLNNFSIDEQFFFFFVWGGKLSHLTSITLWNWLLTQSIFEKNFTSFKYYFIE